MRGSGKRKRNDLGEADDFHRFKSEKSRRSPKVALGRGQTYSLEGKRF